MIKSEKEFLAELNHATVSENSRADVQRLNALDAIDEMNEKMANTPPSSRYSTNFREIVHRLEKNHYDLSTLNPYEHIVLADNNYGEDLIRDYYQEQHKDSYLISGKYDKNHIIQHELENPTQIDVKTELQRTGYEKSDWSFLDMREYENGYRAYEQDSTTQLIKRLENGAEISDLKWPEKCDLAYARYRVTDLINDGDPHVITTLIETGTRLTDPAILNNPDPRNQALLRSVSSDLVKMYDKEDSIVQRGNSLKDRLDKIDYISPAPIPTPETKSILHNIDNGQPLSQLPYDDIYTLATHGWIPDKLVPRYHEGYGYIQNGYALDNPDILYNENNQDLLDKKISKLEQAQTLDLSGLDDLSASVEPDTLTQ